MLTLVFQINNGLGLSLAIIAAAFGATATPEEDY